MRKQQGFMKQKCGLTLALLIALCGSVLGQSADQWRRASGPREDTLALFSHGQSLFAGTLNGGIYRSTNRGESWTPVNTGLPANLTVNAFAASGTYLFAGTSGRGVFRSTDNGQSWTAVNEDLPSLGVAAFAVSGTSLFAGLTTDGVWRSADNGQSWTEMNAGLAPRNVRALAAPGTALFASVADVGVFRSTDNGASWTAAHTGFAPNATINAFEVSGTTLLAGTAGGAIYRSTDNGQSWSKANTGQTNQEVLDFAASGTNLFAATRGDGVLLSTDQGASWRPINTGLTSRIIRSLAVNGPFLFASAQGGGLFINDSIDQVASVSAASFNTEEVAAESIVAAFGAGLATATETATALPLPASLAGTRVTVRDSAGAERPAPLFFVSPNQVNYQIPPGTAAGPATVVVTSANEKVSLGTAQIVAVAPGLFAANGNGQGVAAAVALRIKANGAQSFEPVARYDAAQKAFVCSPIDLGPESDQLFLILYGAGLRFHSSMAAVTARIGGTDAQVLYAGAQGGFVGLDQINLRLPRSLAGRDAVAVTLTADGKLANPVTVCIR